MTDRRSFLINSLIAGSSFLVPASLVNRAGSNLGKNRTKADSPLILSTWNHGMPANERAWQVLRETGSIVDSVEQGVRVTENDPDNLSVGLQGLPDREGIVTLDASIMKGDGSCGSVAFVRRVKHPISLARLVMDETPHIMLAGEGARRFAEEKGFEMMEEELSPKAEQAYREWLEKSEYKPVINIENHDTIGMIGLDENGNMAGSCTTSGLAYKMHGRVGDSPIIGAGLYVDNEAGAATATGLGESIIRICGSFLIVELMRQGRTPQEACEEAVKRLVSKHESVDDIQAGFLAMNKDGDWGAYAVRPGFNYARQTNSGNELIDSGSYIS